MSEGDTGEKDADENEWNGEMRPQSPSEATSLLPRCLYTVPTAAPDKLAAARSLDLLPLYASTSIINSAMVVPQKEPR